MIEIHKKLIEKFGGTHGLRDDDALKSAMAAAENRAAEEKYCLNKLRVLIAKRGKQDATKYYGCI